MSHLIATDAPLSSPLSDSHTIPWDAHLQPTGLLYQPQPHFAVGLYPHAYALPTATPQAVPSPPAAALKSSRMGTPSSEPEQTLCLPTHQLFDIPPDGLTESAAPSPSPSPAPEQARERLSISINPSAVPAKRPSTAPSSTSKKPRANTSTKDFIPPDVSGLSKREARLVKNRAAAFLSRQRKREEFENMEV
ncbi:uncharacterized protein FIBRA_08108 [Fibroporia radiculosa]|uniref:BZIP domain-containing protein n=1 Tax=Fibroporia radiculosa TaxID=599839 RepID=J4IC65_9APHY|nr:uncharacterized protein FIBRA_08108 [Fibroporia radiculosa]CCM05871.1 predicted protein [Fibroporia radiculosa]